MYLYKWLPAPFKKKKEKGVEGSFSPGSDGKESACSAGDPGSIPGSRRSPGEGNGNLLQYSYLENSMDRGAWLATVHGITGSDTTEPLTLDMDGSRV